MEDIGTTLEQSGLGNIPGLLDAILSVAPTVRALQALPEEDLAAALAPLQLRAFTLKKVQAALSEVRTPERHAIHRGFDFEAEKIDKVSVSMTPRSHRGSVEDFSTPPPPPPEEFEEAEEEAPPPPPQADEFEAMPPPPPPVETELDSPQSPGSPTTPSYGNGGFKVQVPTLSIAPPGSKTIPTPGGPALAQFGDDGPIFTPRALAAASSALPPPPPAGEAPEPLFTSRQEATAIKFQQWQQNDTEDMPFFTPRQEPEPAGGTGEPLFTPRSLAAQAPMSARVLQLRLALPADGAQDGAREDAAPIFTPRTMAAQQGLKAGSLGMPLKLTMPAPPQVIAVDDEDGEIFFTPRSVASHKAAAAEAALDEEPAGTPAGDAATGADAAEEAVANGADTMRSEKGGKGKKTPAKKGSKEKKGAKAKKGAAEGAADEESGEGTPAKKEKGKKVAKKGEKSPKKGAKGESTGAGSGPSRFEVRILDAAGEILKALSTELGEKQLKGVLGKDLITPALDSFNVKSSAIGQYRVNGAPADLKAKLSEVVGSAEETTLVDIVLIDDPKAKPKQFLISIVTHRDGDAPLYKMSVPIPDMSSSWFAALAPAGTAWMHRPFSTAIVYPALEAADMAKAKVKAISINGQNIGSAELDCHKYVQKFEEQGHDINVEIKLDKSSEPKSFTIDIVMRNGEVLSSFQTVLSQSLLKKPLLSGLIEPALKHLNVVFPSQPPQLSIKVDGQEMDHRRVVHAETLQFIAPVVDGIKYVNGLPVGNKGDPVVTHVEVLLPAGAYAAEKASKFTVSFHHGSTSTNAMDQLTSEVVGKWMTNSLGVSVIEPAVKAFVKAHPTLTINTKNMSVQINGLDVDTHAITSMYAKAGTHEVFVKCILPERAIIDHAPKFIIDIVDSNGVLITAVEAQLNARWLQKSLGKSLVEPVLRAEQLTDVGWASVTVDGDEVADIFAGKVVDRASKTVGMPARVVVHLKPTERELKPKALSSAVNDPSLAPCDFIVQISLDGEAVVASQTRPTLKWLKGKSLLAALIHPALKANKIHHAAVVAVLVGSVGGPLGEVDATKPATNFMHDDGSPVEIDIKLNHKDPMIQKMMEGASRLGHSVGHGLSHGVGSVAHGLSHGLGSMAHGLAHVLSSGPVGHFVIHIAGADGSRLTEMETSLNSFWLGKSLAEGLIKPALEAIGKKKERWSTVTINGEKIDETLKASVYVDVDGTPVDVLVMLEGADAPPADVPHFIIELWRGDELLSASETKLNPKWLTSPLKKIVEAAVKAHKSAVPGKSAVGSVKVDGEVVDFNEPASTFVREGFSAALAIHLA
jgi:hypothetical protein